MRYKVINVGNIYPVLVSRPLLRLLALAHLYNLHNFLICNLFHFRFKALWLADFY